MIKETFDVHEALNEFYKLKKQFEKQNMMNKMKIIKNPNFSKREKRNEFLKLQPKCINCNNPSRLGTIFDIFYNEGTDEIIAHRTFKIYCGNVTSPCDLNIVINIGKYENINKLIHFIEKEITEIKTEIINDKNNILFGITTSDKILETVNFNRTYISEMTTLYEQYLDKYNNVYENKNTLRELEDKTVDSYNFITEIKECIKKANEENNNTYYKDAVNIYINQLLPTLDIIRDLKNKENFVVYENYNDKHIFKLIQNKNSISDLLINTYKNNVEKFIFGTIKQSNKIKTLKPKSEINIQEDSFREQEQEQEQQNKAEKQIREIPEDIPEYNSDTDILTWNHSEYQILWDKLPKKLQNALKQNKTWLKDFMYKCVNDRQNENYNGCVLINPKELILPPTKNTDGTYNFGIQIYNEVFSKLPEKLKDTYLTLYKKDENGKYDYSMLANALSNLVGKEVDFDRGFF